MYIGLSICQLEERESEKETEMFRASCGVFLQEQLRLCFSHQGEVMEAWQQQESTVWELRLLAASRVYSSSSSLWLHTHRESSPHRSRTRSAQVWQTCSQADKKTRNSSSYYVSLQPASSANHTARGSKQQTCSRVKLIWWHAVLSIIYYTVSVHQP